MKLSYINSFGNKGDTFEAQGISTESLPHQANLNTTHQYLSPDYFLPSSSSESYYCWEYIGSNNLNFKSKSSKIARVASVMLLSLGFLATAIDVKAQPGIEPNPSFLFGKDSAGIHTNIPIPPKMLQSPLLAPDASAMIPPSATVTATSSSSTTYCVIYA